MIISIQRNILSPYCTQGVLSHSRGQCYTLEPPADGIGMPGVHCIPPGQYEVTLAESDEEERYAHLLNGRYQGMPMLREPDEGRCVKIAIGNFPNDTRGDILIGLTQEQDALYESEEAYRLIYPIMVEAIQHGDGVILDIRGGG